MKAIDRKAVVLGKKLREEWTVSDIVLLTQRRGTILGSLANEYRPSGAVLCNKCPKNGIAFDT